MSFIQYIRGERRGKDARDVEMQSLGDPCYHKALLGYDRYRVSGSEKVRDIAELGNRISAMAFTKRSYKLLYILAALIVVAVALTVWLVSYSGDGKAPAKEKEQAGKTVLSPENERLPVDENRNIVVVDQEDIGEAEEPDITDATDGADAGSEAGILQGEDAQLPTDAQIEEFNREPELRNDTVAAAAAEGNNGQTTGARSSLPMFTIDTPDGAAKPVSVPELGSKQYNEYLRRAMDTSAAGGTGDVMLTFRVNQYGRPSDIRAELGFSRDGNREAIRLVSNGPEWQPTGVERVSVTIHFR